MDILSNQSGLSLNDQLHCHGNGHLAGIEYQVVQSRVQPIGIVIATQIIKPSTVAGSELILGCAFVLIQPVHDDLGPIGQRCDNLDVQSLRMIPEQDLSSPALDQHITLLGKTADYQSDHAHIAVQRGANGPDQRRKEPRKG